VQEGRARRIEGKNPMYRQTLSRTAGNMKLGTRWAKVCCPSSMLCFLFQEDVNGIFCVPNVVGAYCGNLVSNSVTND